MVLEKKIQIFECSSYTNFHGKRIKTYDTSTLANHNEIVGT